MTRKRPDTAAELRHAEGKLLAWDIVGERRPCALQPRDAAILGALGRYRFLTTVQIADLFWLRDCALQIVRRRLAKLHAAGYVERFRPQTIRGSYQWIYCLARDGHRAAQQAGELPAELKFTPRREQIFDYRYVVHDLRMNDWAIAYMELAQAYCFRWYGPDECRAEPPKPDRDGHPGYSTRGVYDLKLKAARPIAPDGGFQVLGENGTTLNLLVEYDRTRRVDKNFEKFRRYEHFMCTWWEQHAAVDRGLACALFLCEDADHLNRFLDAADREFVARTHDRDKNGYPSDFFPARRRTFFAMVSDIYDGSFRAFRVPKFPPGHELAKPDDQFEELELPGHGLR